MGLSACVEDASQPIALRLSLSPEAVAAMELQPLVMTGVGLLTPDGIATLLLPAAGDVLILDSLDGGADVELLARLQLEPGTYHVTLYVKPLEPKGEVDSTPSQNSTCDDRVALSPDKPESEKPVKSPEPVPWRDGSQTYTLLPTTTGGDAGQQSLANLGYPIDLGQAHLAPQASQLDLELHLAPMFVAQDVAITPLALQNPPEQRAQGSLPGHDKYRRDLLLRGVQMP